MYLPTTFNVVFLCLCVSSLSIPRLSVKNCQLEFAIEVFAISFSKLNCASSHCGAITCSFKSGCDTWVLSFVSRHPGWLRIKNGMYLVLEEYWISPREMTWCRAYHSRYTPMWSLQIGFLKAVMRVWLVDNCKNIISSLHILVSLFIINLHIS